MSTLGTAEAVYDDVTEQKGDQSASQLASNLEKRADELRQQKSAEQAEELSEGTRDAMQNLMQNTEPEQAEQATDEVATHLTNAASDVRTSLDHNPTMTELDGNKAGQAELESSNVWVDEDAIKARKGDRLIDTEVASDIDDHEYEHNLQSKKADQDSITVNNKTTNLEDVREAAAISVQKKTDFLSTRYKQIIADLPMDAEDRQLVRDGKISVLEKKKNGLEYSISA
jgi:hypothetical protein